MPPLVWIAGGLVALLATSSKAKASSPSGSTRDADALADMLITETGFSGPLNELAQIAYVAVNRARKYRKPIYDIVSPAARSPLWNSSDKYRNRYEAARNNPRWDAARAFATEVLAGTSGYRNLGVTKFVHPGGMPTPPCSSSRTAASTIAGTRCLPSWALKGTTVIGRAMFA